MTLLTNTALHLAEHKGQLLALQVLLDAFISRLDKHLSAAPSMPT